MSTEETNLKMPAPDAAMQEALKLAYAALSVAGTPAGAMAELAYTPTAWGANLIQDFQKQADVDPELEASKNAMLAELDDLIAKVAPDSEAYDRLQEAKRKVQGATDAGTFAAAVSSAQTAMTTATNVITSEAQARRAEINQLWEKIDHIHEENKKDLAALSPYLTDEEKQKEAELEKAVRNAKTDEEKAAATKALFVYHAEIAGNAGERADANGDHAAKAQADKWKDRSNQGVENLDKLNKALAAEKTESHSNNHDQSTPDSPTKATAKAPPALPVAAANAADKSPSVVAQNTQSASYLGF